MIKKRIYICDKTYDYITKSKEKWLALNPEYEVKLYDNKKCISFIGKNFSKTHMRVFEFLKDGPIKADFWRLCILYKKGGVYSDADNVPLIPLKEFINADANFITCSSYWDSGKMNYNPNFIVCGKNNWIIKNCIDWYINKYKKGDKYDYWEWSIMRCLTDVLIIPNYDKQDGLYTVDGMRIQIIKECPGQNHYDAHNIYNGVRVFNNRAPDWDCDSHSSGKKKLLPHFSFNIDEIISTYKLLFTNVK
jgi:hypothetical protein